GLTNSARTIIRFVHVIAKARNERFFGAVILGCFCLHIGQGSISAAPSKTNQIPPAATRKIDFGSDIQPILAKSCYDCHGPEQQKGGLPLDQKAAALKGGDTGPWRIARKSAESLLSQAVSGTKQDLARLPKKRAPLARERIA